MMNLRAFTIRFFLRPRTKAYLPLSRGCIFLLYSHRDQTDCFKNKVGMIGVK